MAIASKYRDQVKVCELNAGESPASARRMGIQGTPTVVVFQDGKLLGRIVGWRPQSYYEEMIETEFSVKENEKNP